MLLTLLSTLLGFLGAGIPELIKGYNAKQERKHELDVMDRQIAAQAAGHVQRLEEINVQGDIRESEALYKAAVIPITGVRLADAAIALYNSSVRPNITYAFFAMYAIVKLAAVHSAVGVNWLVAFQNSWTESDMALFSVVMGFWFGARSLAKMRGGK